MRFKIFTAVTILTTFFGLRRRVNCLVEASVLDKPAVSIFRAEARCFETLTPPDSRLTTSSPKMVTARFLETLVSANQSTRRLNSKEHQS
jgi:hypothetical protein